MLLACCVRLLRIVCAWLLVITALTACSAFGESDEERAQRLLDEDAAIVVFLADDAAPQQKVDIEARLRALPDVTNVVFEDKQQAYDRMKEGLTDDQLDGFTPESLPEAFRAEMTDQAAVRQLRDSQVKGELSALAGVSEVVIPCTTVAQCRENARELTTPRSPG